MNLTEEAKLYLEYLKKHIHCVELAYNKLNEIIEDLFDGYDYDVILRTENNIKHHDSIKFSAEKLKIYGEHYLGKHDKDEYNKLIHDHIKNCPHHFQHWLVFYTIENIQAIEIPYEYIIEMICDWYSFSFMHNDEYEIIKWYSKSRDKMIFAPKTQEIIDRIIGKIEEYLKSEQRNNK